MPFIEPLDALLEHGAPAGTPSSSASLEASLPSASSLADGELRDHRLASPSPLLCPLDAANHTRTARRPASDSLSTVIVAHLDLDAFFAAVEELESPELRGRPLVVGGDPHGRGVVATANYAARRFGIFSAMSCAEALRRCPTVTFVPAAARRSTASTRRRSGRSSARSCRRSSRPGSTRATSTSARSRPPSTTRARSRRPCRPRSARRTRLSCSLGLASSKVVAKIASDRRKPGGLTIVRPGREAAFLAPLAIRLLPGIGPRAEARLARGRHRDDRRARRALRRRAARAPSGQGRPHRARPRARDRPAAARGLDRAHLDLERGDVPAGRRRPRAAARRAARGWPIASRSTSRARADCAHRDDEAPLSRLRDPHALDLAAGRHRRRGSASASSRAPCSTARSATARGRCGSSASASPGSPTTRSSS